MIATVLLLAGLPLLARRWVGPASPSRAGRALRVFCFAALLGFLPALAIVEAFANLTPARPGYRRVFCDIQGCDGVPGRSTGGRRPGRGCLAGQPAPSPSGWRPPSGRRPPGRR